MCPDAEHVVPLDAFPRPILDDHPEWIDLYNFAWQLAVQKIRRSRGILHMDTAWDPDRNYQWVWDLTFVGLFCRYAAEYLPVCGSYDLFYQLQGDDGYISMTYDFDTDKEPWPDRINPPLFAWGEWEYYRTTGDASRFTRVVPHIEKLMDWIDRNRTSTFPRSRQYLKREDAKRAETSACELYFFKDCGSSGMDDSPRTPRTHEAGRHFAWIDICAQMVLSFRCLGRMHAVLGDTDRARHWEQRAADLGERINLELWSDRTRFYHDKSFPVNFVGHKTAASFWPILAGVCTGERLNAMVTHLQNEREFNRPTPVPSLSADDCNYSPVGRYWVGGVWAPTNYMITRGLMLADRGNAAHDIAVKYLAALARTYRGVEPHTLWECNSPESDEPGLAFGTLDRVKPDFVGWSGIGPIAMLIENILGIDLDVPQQRLTWDIRLMGRHGIQQLAAGGSGRIDLLCRQRNANEPACCEVQSTRAMELLVRCEGRAQTVAVAPGPMHTFTV